jgi:hypothetical protein
LSKIEKLAPIREGVWNIKRGDWPNGLRSDSTSFEKGWKGGDD